ncbi:GNAT family N-acetyltransferase [Ferrimonas senticii]|uniref:GNAT family N-acetyltransferase n=1 Tax=Ferrimonas senticii TaxID=394566 RepID=UPI00040C1BCE|nr:GNAT family N-acetyltransferase [Ferrimonas senticii]
MLHNHFVTSLAEVTPQQWNSLFGQHDPFCDYRFLRALEQHHCVGEHSGWLPQYWLLFDGQKLIAAAPLYIKRHSYGEYLFDWGWAEAYQRHGLRYYPKLLAAIPFTPASGCRLGHLDAIELATVTAQFTAAVTTLAQQIGASNAQVLFPTTAQCQQLADQGWLTRRDLQFHWLNRGYADFNDFLASMTARKRKSISKERRRLSELPITIRCVAGAQISPALWQQFYRCYQQTYAKRSGHGGYLSLGFFQELGRVMPEQLLLQVAYSQHADPQVLAAALFFKSDSTLYGRYWGTMVELDGLHFELCYYRGIDYCIRHGLSRFESGAQGQHKIPRGFEPQYVYGNALLFDSPFADAISDFCQQEWQQMAQHKQQLAERLPFKHQ